MTKNFVKNKKSILAWENKKYFFKKQNVFKKVDFRKKPLDEKLNNLCFFKKLKNRFWFGKTNKKKRFQKS